MQKWLLILVLFTLQKMSYSQNLFDFDKTTQYAQYLFKTKQYKLVIEELERAVYLSPDNDSIKSVLIKTYLIDEQYSEGYNRCKIFYPETSNLPNSISNTYLTLLIKLNKWEEARYLIASCNSLSDEMKKNYEISLAFHIYDVKYIENIYLKNDTLKYPSILSFDPLVKIVKNEKLKRPGLAAGLSTIVPGLGKIYAKDYKDGIVSFVFVSLSAWQSYRGFEKRGTKSVYGYIYGGLTLAFYSGNIFGAYKSAKKYNRELKAEVSSRASKIVSENLK